MSAMDDHAAAPADEASAGVPVVQRVRRDRRGPVALVLVIAALALAVLEPWDRDDASPPDARSTDPSLRTPAAVVAVATDAASTPPLASPATTPPVDRATPALDADATCARSPGWRLVVMTRAGETRLRSRAAVSPVAAATPTAADVPVVPVSADELEGIGWCVPRRDRAYEVEFPARITVWRLADGGPTRVEALTPLTFADPPLGEELYAPPRSNGPEIRSWPPGRYAIGYETTGDPRVWWVGLDFSAAP